MSDQERISAEVLADITSVSKSTLEKWERAGKLTPLYDAVSGKKEYALNELMQFEAVSNMFATAQPDESSFHPIRKFNSIELFAGAGGLAIGLERAGFNAVALNEFNKDACNTLRINRPNWNVIEGDIQQVDFTGFADIDFVSGGFPCQAFSYAGNQRGFEDTRGTLFFEFARAIKEMQPKVFLGENVRGLLAHDDGKTLASIKAAIADLGYTLIEPRVLKAIFFRVPQKRERLFLVGIRNDLVKYAQFNWPMPHKRVMVLRDALKAGELYPSDVADSKGQGYPERKKAILDLIPPGGYWRDLPDALQREYMQKSYFLGGGKTGMARRLAWDEPSLTLTCAPAQKQTERCHPEETRPLKIREYARIQTFPDGWEFAGSVTSQYKQIGNAVPVNLAYAMGRSLISLLNSIEAKVAQPKTEEVMSVIPRAKTAQLPLFQQHTSLGI